VDRLTVLTWNLQGRAPGRAGLSTVLNEVVPDLILLQEVDPDAIAADAQLATWHWYAVDGAGHSPGMATMSRRPPLQVETLGPGALPGGHEVMALNVHARAPLPMPLLHAAPRNRQLAALGAWIEERAAAGSRMVVAGDFNAVRCRLDGLVDTAEALRTNATWRPFGVPWLPAVLRLDRVFVSPSITPLATRVICHVSWSDHCPLLATLSVQ
jgi:endonuclease/exonuclease/phosphatase family metal-dependent hydrolase